MSSIVYSISLQTNCVHFSELISAYEPVQVVRGSSHGVALIPLDTLTFDLDVIQRLQHGTTVIHYEPDSGRSNLCLLRLDPSCGQINWHKISYSVNKDPKEKVRFLYF